MQGEPGVGTYVAYGLLCLFILLIVLVFLRTVVMFSLLWIQPLVTVLRRVPGVRLLLPRPESPDRS
jgi:hypothetical protein